MASTLFLSLHLLLILLLLSPHPTLSLTCTTQTLPRNKLFQHCQDLPTLASFLHWTYTPSTPTSNSTLSFAFLARPSSPSGWIAWSINPTAPKMLGSQALIAYKNPNGAMTVKTFNVSGYKVAPSDIDYDVQDMAAEEGADGVMKIFATLVLPESLGSVINQVWQVGGSVKNGVPDKHAFAMQNINAAGKLDLLSGGGVAPGGRSGGGGDSRLRKKNIHGILNVVSWGILFPIGIIIARYLRIFESADPAWFYLHISCQLSAYIIGVAGWGTGLKLGSQSEGIRYTSHRNIGIVLFSFATLQIFALFLRPKKEHKYRLYWNYYHHGVGYLIVVLGIVNVFKGLGILDPEKKWKSAYIIVLAVLGGIVLLLEAITWVIVLKRKSNKSTKPYDGHSGA